MNRAKTIFAIAATTAALSTAACGSSSPKATPAAVTGASTPVAQSYPDVASLLAAMAVHGAICSGATFNSGGAVPGEVNPYAECSGISNGDTSVLVFTDRATALAYGNDMIRAGQSLGPTAEVVGPDWTVNTVPAFASKVISAVGGQLISAPVAASSATATNPGPAEPTDPSGQQCVALDASGYCPGDDPSPSQPAPTMTKQTDTIVFKVWGTGEHAYLDSRS